MFPLTLEVVREGGGPDLLAFLELRLVLLLRLGGQQHPAQEVQGGARGATEVQEEQEKCKIRAVQVQGRREVGEKVVEQEEEEEEGLLVFVFVEVLVLPSTSPARHGPGGNV